MHWHNGLRTEQPRSAEVVHHRTSEVALREQP